MLQEERKGRPAQAGRRLRFGVPQWLRMTFPPVLIRAAQLFCLLASLAAGWHGLDILNTDSQQTDIGLAWIGGAAVLFALLAAWTQRTATLKTDTDASNLWRYFEPLLSRGRLLGISLTCALLAVGLANEPWMRPWPVLFLWGAGVALFPLGLRQLKLDPAHTAAVEPRIGAYTHGELLLLAILTIAALAVRAIALDSAPFPVHGDEGEMGLVARAIIAGEATNPFETVWLGHPMVWFFGQALALTLFGNDLTGLRMFSAILGAATIPACYALFRPLAGRSVALMTALLLTAFHMHVHYSRIALNNIGDPLMGVLAFGAFFHALRTRSTLSLALTGLLIGLAQHLYFGTRLLPIVLVAVIIHRLIVARQEILQFGWRWLLLLLGVLIGFGPLLRFYIEHSYIYMERLGSVGLFQTGRFDELRAMGLSVEAIFFEQIRQSIGLFFWRPDSSLFYWTNSALFDQASALLFLFGLAAVIARPKQPESALALAWLFGMLALGAVLLIDPPQTPRYVTAAPVFCFLIALGLERLRQFVRMIIGLPQRVSIALSGLVIAGLMIWNLSFYFQIVTPRYYYGGSLNVTTAAYTLRALPPKRFIYTLCFPAFYITHGTLRFLAPGISGVDVIEPLQSADDLPGLPEGWRPYFILLPERTSDLQLIQSRYPDGVLREYRDPYRPEFVLFLTYEPR